MSKQKLWIGYVSAIAHDLYQWNAVIVSEYSSVTRKAGVKEIRRQADAMFPSDRYKKYTIEAVIGITLADIVSRFPSSDGDDDEGGNDDMVALDPSPEDHGVEVPLAFAELIDGLRL